MMYIIPYCYSSCC